MSFHYFSDIPLKPADAIFGVSQACSRDPYSNKINLTVGAYRNNDGKNVVLNSVRQAERIIFENEMDHEYLPLEGLPEFISSHANLVFGDNSEVIVNKRVASIQAVSGTGSLRLGAEFLKRFAPVSKVYIPNVTWVSHWNIFKDAGFETIPYSYLDSTGLQLDFEGFIRDLSNCPSGSVVLLHMIAHNPSGIDPSQEQWNEIFRVVSSQRLIPFIDNAYQGFANDIETDAYSVRLFASSNIDFLVASSCSKNFGLYGQRAGCLHVVSQDSLSTSHVLSQLKGLSRTLVSNCPAHGARIVALILNNPTLKSEWVNECQEMCNRLNFVRTRLYELLIEHNVPGNWNHLLTQRGMFSFTGLSKKVIEKLQQDHHIYMLDNGRISLAGLNTSNIEQFVQAIKTVILEIGNDK